MQLGIYRSRLLNPHRCQNLRTFKALIWNDKNFRSLHTSSNIPSLVIRLLPCQWLLHSIAERTKVWFSAITPYTVCDGSYTGMESWRWKDNSRSSVALLHEACYITHPALPNYDKISGSSSTLNHMLHFCWPCQLKTHLFPGWIRVVLPQITELTSKTLDLHEIKQDLCV